MQQLIDQIGGYDTGFSLAELACITLLLIVGIVQLFVPMCSSKSLSPFYRLFQYVYGKIFLRCFLAKQYANQYFRADKRHPDN